MTSLYYEQHIQSKKVSTKDLIKLSESRRTFNKTNRINEAEKYYCELQKLCQTIRYRRIPLKVHPHFQFDKIKSTNWNVELLRVASIYKNLLIDRASTEDDLKVKNRTLLQAMKLSNACSQYSTSILFDDEDNRLFKELNPQYHLAQSLNLAADRFFNMYKFQTNFIAIKKAFQLKELSYLLWKEEDNIVDVVRYKAKALLELAKKIEDDECGQKVALLENIVTKEVCPEDVKSQYEVWKQQNSTVYYKPVVTDKSLEVISLEEAFHTLSKCFESPST